MGLRKVVTVLVGVSLVGVSSTPRIEPPLLPPELPIVRIQGTWIEIDLDGDGEIDAFGGCRHPSPPGITAADLNAFGKDL